MKSCIILFILILSLTDSPFLLSQKQAWNWYMGKKAGLNFDTNNCRPDTTAFHRPAWGSSAIAFGSISDSNGIILLYYDGDSLRNNSQDVVKNGYDLFPQKIFWMPTIFIPMPGNPNIYYLFGSNLHYEGNLKIYPDDPRTGLWYSVIDISRNGGKGEVIEKKVLLKKHTGAQLSAVYHRNGRDVWLITHDWGEDKFVNYLITGDGIKDSVISYGKPNDQAHKNGIGKLAVSPDGKHIAETMGYMIGMHIFDFDDSAGQMSNLRIIDTGDTLHLSSQEFSPDSKRIYVWEYSTFFTPKGNPSCKLYEVDLDKLHSGGPDQAFSRTKYETKQLVNSMRLTPDGRIAVMPGSKDSLGVIECPDAGGNYCEFKENWVSITSRQSQFFPSFIVSWFNIKKVLHTELVANTPVCAGSQIVMRATEVKCSNYEWTGPADFHSGSMDVVIQTADSSNSGMYYCKVTKCESFYLDSIEIKVFNAPGPSIVTVNGKTDFCNGDTVLLVTSNKFNNYRWSTGATTKEIKVSSQGTYTVETLDSNGCTGKDEITLNFHPQPNPEIWTSNQNNTPCQGDSVIMKTIPGMSVYKWLNAATSEVISTVDSAAARVSGTYKVYVENEFGCGGFSDTVNVVIRNESNNLSIESSTPGIIDFDIVPIGTTRMISLRIRNIGRTVISITNIPLSFNTRFSIPESQFPIEIQPGEMKEVNIIFYSTKTGSFSDTLLLSDVCSDMRIISMARTEALILSGGTRCRLPLQFTVGNTSGGVVLDAYPNPTSGFLAVEYFLPAEGTVDLGIYDAFGKKIPIIQNKSGQTGINKLETDLEILGIQSGIYYLKLKVDGAVKINSVTVIK